MQIVYIDVTQHCCPVFFVTRSPGYSVWLPYTRTKLKDTRVRFRLRMLSSFSVWSLMMMIQKKITTTSVRSNNFYFLIVKSNLLKKMEKWKNWII